MDERNKELLARIMTALTVEKAEEHSFFVDGVGEDVIKYKMVEFEKPIPGMRYGLLFTRSVTVTEEIKKLPEFLNCSIEYDKDAHKLEVRTEIGIGKMEYLSVLIENAMLYFDFVIQICRNN